VLAREGVGRTGHWHYAERSATAGLLKERVTGQRHHPAERAIDRQPYAPTIALERELGTTVAVAIEVGERRVERGVADPSAWRKSYSVPATGAISPAGCRGRRRAARAGRELQPRGAMRAVPTFR
jgi:hypothetical protein